MTGFGLTALLPASLESGIWPGEPGLFIFWGMVDLANRLQNALGKRYSIERFLQEIRTAAQLSHPNILSLIDSGEEDGLLSYILCR